MAVLTTALTKASIVIVKRVGCRLFADVAVQLELIISVSVA